MELADKYSPADIEEKWYDYWTRNGLFRSVPDRREPYAVVIPPPNVTGILHMGHMLNNTIQDVLVRRARMLGKNACWVPGTDHASIATEAKVVARLKQQGIDKADLTREQFMEHAWRWKEEHGGMILRQLRRLGASCDWDRTAFTMDEVRSRSVVKAFVDLYNKGLIYRGVRMVNWDPSAQTALSDEEVVYRETAGKLYYLRYRIEGEDGWVTVATTRPETIAGDTALCVNPADARYAHLKGKRVTVPLVGRSVPVIFDEYVDTGFGTGALKVTPAHDINDYMLGQKHGLESVDIFNPDGTVNAAAGRYAGMDRFELRGRMEDDLAAAGLLEKAEAYVNNVGYSERTGAAIEPKLSMQWFLRMESLAGPALEAVESGQVNFVPAKFRNVYRHWMENIRDWCISRQLWWGHRIPAWYLPTGEIVVAESRQEALAAARRQRPDIADADMRQEEDVLDTWFSSWLWPISVFDGIMHPDNEDIKYYYPTADLITAPDIIFFWVARMIMAGYEYRAQKPFGNVYFTGLVRDKQRRKMSKQLGNSPDALELIGRYGADGVRTAMLFCSAAGNDLMFDESLCEQGRNFANKVWNAYRLVAGWRSDPAAVSPESGPLAGEWFAARLDKALAEMETHFAEYRLQEALMTVYRLFWDDFSGWYLETVKPAYGEPIDAATLARTKDFFDKLLRALHPFMPFVTEHLWQSLAPRAEGESIMISPMPAAGAPDTELLARFELAKEAVTGVRGVRTANGLPQKQPLTLRVIADENYPAEWEPVIMKMANLSAVERIDDKDEGAAAFMVKTTQYFVPTSDTVDVRAELTKLRSELEYAEGFLAAVMKKLGNERFVQGAPEAVVENERNKRADAQARIAALRGRIETLERMGDD